MKDKEPKIFSGVAVGWICGIAVLATLFLIFVAFPALISAHNDGLVIAAFVCLFVGLTIPVVTLVMIVVPYFRGDYNEE